MIEVYLDPSLKGRGYSTVKDYENDSGYVTIGYTNEGGKPTRKIIIVVFRTLNCEVIGGDPEWKEWKAPENQPDDIRDRLMWQWLMRGITPANLQSLLEQSFQRGREFGRAEMRAGFWNLMGGNPNLD